MLQSLDPKSLDPAVVKQMKQTDVVWKHTTMPKASLHADHTLKTKHTVGQVVHNVHKILRVLEKSNYLSRFHKVDVPTIKTKPTAKVNHEQESVTQGQGGAMTGSQSVFGEENVVKKQSASLQHLLEQGCPTTYGRIMRYLAFDSSTAFVTYLRANGINMQIQYLAESKFMKEFSKVMIDLFKYRVALLPEQFITRGYTERKMVLVLDLYDVIKQIRKISKVGYKLNMKDQRWEHPCDQPMKHYHVVDHARGVTKEMQFNMNACLMKSNVTCQNERLMSTDKAEESTEAAPDRINCSPGPRANDIEIYHLERKESEQSQAAAPEASVYSVSHHYERAELKNQRKEKNRGEKMGTSKQDETDVVEIKVPNRDYIGYNTANPVISEANERSEESKSINNLTFKLRQQENSGSTNPPAAPVKPTVAPVDDQQMQMVMTLTQTITSLGGKFEQMGQSFESKLAQIESRHRELEQKLAETSMQVDSNEL